MASSSVIFLALISTMLFLTKSMAQEVESVSVRDQLFNTKKLLVVAKEIDETDGGLREKRAPQFFAEYDDYSDVAESRHLRLGHRHRTHRRPHYHGGHGGCRGHGCYQGQGWQPQQGGYYNQGAGSFASASAGSNGFHNGGGQSQANAQSATFSLGPLSATFSQAEAASGVRGSPSFFDY